MMAIEGGLTCFHRCAALRAEKLKYAVKFNLICKFPSWRLPKALHQLLSHHIEAKAFRFDEHVNKHQPRRKIGQCGNINIIPKGNGVPSALEPVPIVQDTANVAA